MVLREKDDADYYYNVYRENPTKENLDQLIKYRPQDNYDEINKRVALESIREEIKSKNNKEGKKLTEKDFGFPKMVEKTNIIIEKAEEKKMSFKIKERKDILVKEIILSTKNPRKHFRGAGMEELKDSIKKTGLIQPILIKEIGNNHYEAIAGNRRLFAFQELKKETIPVIIIEADSEIAESDIALIENLVRDDLSPIEEAQAYINRWEKMGYENQQFFTDYEIAGKLSKELLMTIKTDNGSIIIDDSPGIDGEEETDDEGKMFSYFAMPDELDKVKEDVSEIKEKIDQIADNTGDKTQKSEISELKEKISDLETAIITMANGIKELTKTFSNISKQQEQTIPLKKDSGGMFQ